MCQINRKAIALQLLYDVRSVRLVMGYAVYIMDVKGLKAVYNSDAIKNVYNFYVYLLIV